MSCLKSPLTLAAAGLLAAAAGMAGAQAPAPREATETEFTSRARAWLAGRYQLNPASIGVQALDPRVQSRGCPAGWQFDQPFPGNDGMLRGRCTDSGWQVFVKVTLPAQAQAPAQAAGPSGQPLASNAPAMAPVMAPVMIPAPGAPVMSPQAAAMAPTLVRRGQTVLTTWTPVAGLQVSARLEAMDDGRLGETVRLKNRDSGRIVSAIVNGQNTAQGL